LITIQFEPVSVDNAMVDAIQVIPQPASPTLTPVPDPGSLVMQTSRLDSPLERPTVIPSTGSVWLPEGVNLAVAPNPAKEAARVFLRLNTPSAVTLVFYNLSGNLVLQRPLGELSAGVNQADISVQGLATGLYFVTAKAGSATIGVFKLVVVR
jgi:hypothetical protein